MKWSTRIIVALLLMIFAGLFVSNWAMKKEYDKADKNDIYWTYASVLNQHFKYLHIDGGNITKIAFEQSPNCSVRILNTWQRNHPELIKSEIKNDTLFIKFIYTGKESGERSWLKSNILVRIFAPEILSVDGYNTNLEMYKLKQNNISANISGKSKFEVESLSQSLDSIRISQKDSSEVIFEMSPDFRLPKGTLILNQKLNGIKSPEAMTIQYIDAKVEGYSLLDLGHAQIKNLNLNISDSSAIILAGSVFKRRY